MKIIETSERIRQGKPTGEIHEFEEEIDDVMEVLIWVANTLKNKVAGNFKPRFFRTVSIRIEF